MRVRRFSRGIVRRGRDKLRLPPLRRADAAAAVKQQP